MHQIRSFPVSNAHARQQNFGINRCLLASVLSIALGSFALPAWAQSDADADADADASESESESESSSSGDAANMPSIYVEYSLGLSIVPNQSLTGADRSGNGLSGRSEQNPGYTFGGAIGLKLYEHFRAEARVDYRSSEVDRMATQGEPKNAKGDLRLVTLMLNGYFDYDLDVGVVPYVGFGMGWGQIELSAQNSTGALQTNVSDTDSVFVWNAMVGGTYPISEVTEISLGYRYVQTEDPSYSGRVAGDSRRLDHEFDAHELHVGLRFNF